MFRRRLVYISFRFKAKENLKRCGDTFLDILKIGRRILRSVEYAESGYSMLLFSKEGNGPMHSHCAIFLTPRNQMNGKEKRAQTKRKPYREKRRLGVQKPFVL